MMKCHAVSSYAYDPSQPARGSVAEKHIEAARTRHNQQLPAARRMTHGMKFAQVRNGVTRPALQNFPANLKRETPIQYVDPLVFIRVGMLRDHEWTRRDAHLANDIVAAGVAAGNQHLNYGAFPFECNCGIRHETLPVTECEREQSTSSTKG